MLLKNLDFFILELMAFLQFADYVEKNTAPGQKSSKMQGGESITNLHLTNLRCTLELQQKENMDPQKTNFVNAETWLQNGTT